MNEIVPENDASLWFMDDANDLMEYSEGGLAEQIFAMADQRITREQREIMASLIDVSPAVAELAKGLKKTQRLKLVFSDEIKEKLRKGTYHLMKTKDPSGLFKAVVVDSKGKIKALADLQWEEVCKGVDISKMTSAMQGMAIQQQLRDIAGQLEDMSSSMEDVLMGQHNDRLALFFCGEAIYREALATTDLDRKKQLSSAAIMSLTDAITKLQTSLAYEIQGICEKYDKEKERFVGVKVDKLREKMFLINSAYQAIHKATTLKAAIYYQEGEYKALTTVLSDYKAFLERSLPEETAHILYLADPNEKSISGTWDIRQNELPMRIEETKLLLGNKAEYALEAKLEDLE